MINVDFFYFYKEYSWWKNEGVAFMIGYLAKVRWTYKVFNRKYMLEKLDWKWHELWEELQYYRACHLEVKNNRMKGINKFWHFKRLKDTLWL